MRKQTLGRRHGALSLRPTTRPTSASESGRKRSRSWRGTSSSATQDFFNERASRCHLETIERLTWRDFLANVRELESTIKRMIVLGDPRLGAPARQTANGEYEAAPASKAAPGSLRDISRKAALAAEHNATLKALGETRWNRARAAKLLDISYRSLLYKIKDADLDGKRRNSLQPGATP